MRPISYHMPPPTLGFPGSSPRVPALSFIFMALHMLILLSGKPFTPTLPTHHPLFCFLTTYIFFSWLGWGFTLVTNALSVFQSLQQEASWCQQSLFGYLITLYCYYLLYNSPHCIRSSLRAGTLYCSFSSPTLGPGADMELALYKFLLNGSCKLTTQFCFPSRNWLKWKQNVFLSW